MRRGLDIWITQSQTSQFHQAKKKTFFTFFQFKIHYRIKTRIRKWKESKLIFAMDEICGLTTWSYELCVNTEEPGVSGSIYENVSRYHPRRSETERENRTREDETAPTRAAFAKGQEALRVTSSPFRIALSRLLWPSCSVLPNFELSRSVLPEG